MKSKLFLSVLLVTFLHGYVSAQGRIYGGDKIDISRAPYMATVAVALEKLADGSSKIYNCGGTILRTNLILTAGHCCLNDTSGTTNEAGRYYVNVGTNNNDLTGGVIHGVKMVNLHPRYMGGGDNHFFHDVCVLQLNDNIKLNRKSQLVELARSCDKPKEGTDGTVTGYGTNPDHNNDIHLYQVHLKVITAEKCHEKLAGGTLEQVRQHQICAEAPGKNQCQGDSGGPFHDVSTGRQVGIVSYGAKDCTAAYPAILARVTDNLDFINRIIKKVGTSSGPSQYSTMDKVKPSPVQASMPPFLAAP